MTPAFSLFENRLRVAVSGVEDGPMNFTGNSELDEDRRQNRERFLLKSRFDPSRQVHSTLVHGPHVRAVWEPTPPGVVAPEADALVTVQRGLPLTMGFADCPPVVLWAPGSPGVLAIVHCGWRPLSKGILGATLGVMAREFGAGDPFKVKAWIGPGVCRQCYEIGPEVASLFGAEFDDPHTGKTHFSLEDEIRDQLTGCGVPRSAIKSDGRCTKHQVFFPIAGGDLLVNEFYSYRREKSNPLSTNMLAVEIMK